MHDITTREDIITLVNTFYDDVKKDKTIGHIFKSIIGEDWSHHLPIMYAFWESVLFSKPGYSGNPIQKHIEINKTIPLTSDHFAQWLTLWQETVDRLYKGDVADIAKKRASTIVTLMQVKINDAQNPKHIY